MGKFCLSMVSIPKNINKLITILAITIIVIGWTIIFWDCLILDPLLVRDDLPIINEIRSTKGIFSYFTKFFNGDYFDLQPVRDATFFINVFLERSIKYGAFHLFNTLVSALILINVWTILKYYLKNELVINLIVVLLAFHPSLNVTSAWTVNRKHLLSVLFILLYYKNWKNHNGHTLKNIFYYFLSIFSQPICVFVPVFMIFRKKLRFLDFVVIGLMILNLVSNYYYYSFHHYFFHRNTYFHSIFEFDWLLGLGRLFSQIVIPLIFAAEYDPGSIFSIIGISIMFLSGLYSYKKFKYKNLDHILFLIVISSFYPIVRLGQFRDAYSIITLIAFFPWLMIELSKYSKRLLYVSFFFLFPIYFFQSYTYVDTWESDRKLYSSSATKEGGALNLLNYAYFNRLYEPDLAYNLSVQIRNNYPNGKSFLLDRLVAESFFYTKLKNEKEKLNIYLSKEGSGIYHHFFKYKFLAKNGYLTEAQRSALMLKNELDENSQLFTYFSDSICIYYPGDCKNLGLIR